MEYNLESNEGAQPATLPPIGNRFGAQALIRQREKRVAESQDITHQLGAARLNLDTQKFGREVSHTEFEHSLEQEKLMLERLRVGEQLAEQRFKVETAKRTSVALQSAILDFSKLETSDPKYEEKRAGILAANADALGSPLLHKTLEWKDNQWGLLQKARHDRNAAAYADPDAKAAFDTYGAADPALGNIAAESVLQQKDRLKKVAADPDLPNDIRQSLYDPSSGKFNYGILDKAEMAAASARADNKGKADPLKAAQKGFDSFYKGVARVHGVTAEDLNQIDATPGVVVYQDAEGKPVSAETVKGKEPSYFATATLGDKVVKAKLPDFNAMLEKHRSIQATMNETKTNAQPVTVAQQAPAVPTQPTAPNVSVESELRSLLGTGEEEPSNSALNESDVTSSGQ